MTFISYLGRSICSLGQSSVYYCMYPAYGNDTEELESVSNKDSVGFLHKDKLLLVIL